MIRCSKQSHRILWVTENVMNHFPRVCSPQSQPTNNQASKPTILEPNHPRMSISPSDISRSTKNGASSQAVISTQSSAIPSSQTQTSGSRIRITSASASSRNGSGTGKPTRTNPRAAHHLDTDVTMRGRSLKDLLQRNDSFLLLWLITSRIVSSAVSTTIMTGQADYSGSNETKSC